MESGRAWRGEERVGRRSEEEEDSGEVWKGRK
jgi:hypothetical protein